MIPDAAALREVLRAWPTLEHPALPGRTNHLRAGVCVPLRWRGDRLECVVTLRPTSLGRHGGEVSFPGGRPEAGEALAETALRECEEEIGLRPVEVLGRLASMPIYTSDWRLEPWVGVVEGEPVGSPDEVEQVLTLDVGAILAEGSVETVTVSGRGQTFDMPIYRPGGFVMFGATALTFTELLAAAARAAGVAPPGPRPSALPWQHLLTHGARAALLGGPVSG